MPLLDLVKRLLGADRRSTSQPELDDIPNLTYRREAGIVENLQTYTATPDDLDSLNFVDIDFMDHYREYYVNEYVVRDLEKSLNALKTNPFWGTVG